MLFDAFNPRVTARARRAGAVSQVIERGYEGLVAKDEG
jgi:hypothetical protein